MHIQFYSHRDLIDRFQYHTPHPDYVTTTIIHMDQSICDGRPDWHDKSADWFLGAIGAGFFGESVK